MPLSQEQGDVILSQANALLDKRAYPKTICPSEVARAFSREELSSLDAADWRSTMGQVRQVVWQLREKGEVQILQKGKVLSVEALEDIKGPIRVRRAP